MKLCKYFRGGKWSDYYLFLANIMLLSKSVRYLINGQLTVTIFIFKMVIHFYISIRTNIWYTKSSCANIHPITPYLLFNTSTLDKQWTWWNLSFFFFYFVIILISAVENNILCLEEKLLSMHVLSFHGCYDVLNCTIRLSDVQIRIYHFSFELVKFKFTTMLFGFY